MIFTDKLNEIAKILSPEFDRLFDLAISKQQHEGDLLLLHINGSYEPSILELNSHSSEKLSPYVIGPRDEGHSEYAHYKFINHYRQNYIADISHVDYLKEHEYSPEKRENIEQLTELEELTIQLEMLVYLKFWEADMTIKKLYQFIRILSGESYDWHFKVSESSRDTTSTGTRQDIIRLKIRDKAKPISTVLFDVIKLAYKTQIRNSIAHSNYSFQGRHIHPNNYIKTDPASQIQALSFDEWIDMFHTTLILHNELIRLNVKINRYYADLALNGNKITVQITELTPKTYDREIVYRQEWNDYRWKQ